MKKIIDYLYESGIAFTYRYNEVSKLERVQVPMCEQKQVSEIIAICTDEKLTYALSSGLTIESLVPDEPVKKKK